jgi:hypothetical protein
MHFYFSFHQRVYFYFTWVLHKFRVNHKGDTDMKQLKTTNLEYNNDEQTFWTENN